MTDFVKVWTKQHENILDDLRDSNRYIVRKEYIQNKMEDHADLYLEVYNWFYHAAGKIVPPPKDAKYPVWVSLTSDGKIENSPGNVELELDVPRELLLTMDIDKWGRIVNYMYIPSDAADSSEHDKMLAKYAIEDYTAYTTSFYPHIKRKIKSSWTRLFDENIILSPVRVGTIWEIRKEWIVSISK